VKLSNKIISVFDTGKSLKKKVLVGSFWLYVLEFCSNGLAIIQTIILARLLAPEHFGIIGVFTIFAAALESFTKTGFHKALVQLKTIDDNFLNTAWTISIIRGIILFFLLFGFGTFAVEFLDTPKALPVIRVLSLSLLLRGCQNIGIIYFSKNLEFHKQFFWKITAFLGNFFTSIPLAFILRNEWAIVWGVLASDAVALIFSFVLHPYRPSFRFNYRIFKTLFGYGKWLLFSSMVVFFSKQGDKIVITKLLGEATLGIYIIAWRFARIPELITNPIPNALFPAYSKFQDDPMALKEKYIETLKILSLFSIPLVAGIIVLAEPFIVIFIGDQWISAVLPMQVLTLANGFNIITYTSFSLFNAMGETSFNFKVNFVKLLVLTIFIGPLVSYYGVIGASLSYLLLSLAGLIVWKLEIYKLLQLVIKDLRCMVFPAVNTAIFVMVLLYLNLTLPIDQIGSFLGVLCLGSVLYFSVGLVIEKLTKVSFIQDLFKIVRLLKPAQGIKDEDA